MSVSIRVRNGLITPTIFKALSVDVFQSRMARLCVSVGIVKRVLSAIF